MFTNVPFYKNKIMQFLAQIQKNEKRLIEYQHFTHQKYIPKFKMTAY